MKISVNDYSKTVRLIARLDIKGNKLIKSIQLEGVQVIGDPHCYAQKYYSQGADEIILMDAVASLYGRNHIMRITHHIAKHIFIPITVGGGLKTLKDVEQVLKSSADKVAINTAAVKNPSLIGQIAHRFGSQCVVLQVDAKKKNSNKWEVFIDGGRESTGIDVLVWVKKASRLGAGEILLTAIDQEGTGRGYDLPLYKQLCQTIPLPVIASGGGGKLEHLVEIIRQTDIDAIAMAHLLHIKKKSIKKIKEKLIKKGIKVRGG